MPVTINGTTGLSGVDGSAATPPITGTDTDSGIFFPAANTVAVTTGGTERLRINSAGNVGIGTTSPQAKLDIGDTSAAFTASIIRASATGIAELRFADTVDNAGYVSYDHTSNYMRFATSATERMRIDAAGNVGIGGTPANGMLELFKTSGEAVIRINNTVGSAWLTLNGTSAGYIHNVSNTPTIFTTNSVERMRIDASGLITQTNATSGAGAIVGEQTFLLAANGPATTQNVFADFFGATSSISLEASSTYEIVAYAAFLKTTAGTAIWQMLASSAPTRMQGWFIGSPVTGIGQGTIASGTSGVTGSQASTTATFAATGSLTTGVNHNVQMTMLVQTNLATNFRLQLNTVTGTGTPLAGSYYTVKKISATTGTFV